MKEKNPKYVLKKNFLCDANFLIFKHDKNYGHD